MKRIKELALLSLPFVAVPVFLFIGNRLTHSKDKANQEAFRKVLKTEYFEDTVAHYNLYSDSLVIEFREPLKHRQWVGEFFIVKKDKWEVAAHIQMPGKTAEQLGEIRFKNGKATFGGFQLPKDSLSFYRVHCHLVPFFSNGFGVGDVYIPPYLFSSSATIPGKLVLSDQVKDLKITFIDRTELEKLDPDTRLFCRDSIEKLLGHSYSLQ